MMKRFFALCLCGCFALSLGCSDSTEPSNMMQDANAEAVADYEAMIEADNAAMSDDDADTTE